MIVFPNAKINIGLTITGKRPDNFHNIETVFYPIGLKDVLEVVPNDHSQADEFSFSGIEIPAEGQGNICLKALYLIRKNYKVPPLKAHLHKVIPVGAGLGGGSSDAAFFIRLVDQVFGLKMDEAEMVGIARETGSDCAFFLWNKPAFASGKGDEITLIDLNLLGYYMVLLNPGIHISTAEAYAGVNPVNRVIDLKALQYEDISQWKNWVKNNFEDSVFNKYPKIKEIKEYLYGLGALYASMSGSGSSVYGIFKEGPQSLGPLKEHLIWEGQM